MKNFIYTSCVPRCVLEHYDKIDAEYIKNNETKIVSEKIIYTCKDFSLSYDTRSKMLNLVFENLVILDWDIIDGISKKSVVEILNRYLKYGENINGIKRKEMCFKMYETKNGIHAYLISHKLHYKSDASILLKNTLLTDVNHNLLCYRYGNMARITPKKEKDFIQKEGFNNIIYVGNIEHIDPYLLQLTDLIVHTQQFILSSGKSHQEIINFLKNKDF